MISNRTTPEELWERQQICCSDVDYNHWNRQRESIISLSKIRESTIFTVDVFKKRYDFASENFSSIFGLNLKHIRAIREHGDLLESRIHPDDMVQITRYQVEHGQFIYTLPPEDRNNFQQIFQCRMMNSHGKYINVISRHQVLEKDKKGKAWIIMGVIDISPDQIISDIIKHTVVNRFTGDIISNSQIPSEKILTNRELEILQLIQQGLISKEIAYKLNISIYTVNNHRKNILAKLGVDNVIEAINSYKSYGILI